jgi:cytochrome c oxidase subunit II
VSVRRRAVTAALVALAATAVAGCGNLGMPHPVTAQGTESRDLWRIFVWIALVIGAIVYGLVAFVVIRYRRSRSEGEPSQRQYQIPLEIVYTALPLIIVGVLLGLSIRTERKVTHTSADPDLTVRVIGFQWQWQFVYQGSDVTVTGVPGKDPVLVLPVGRTVRLELESSDVVHSFWVPHFIEKRDLIPRVDNAIDVNITEQGEWAGVCSEFCGLNHTAMRFSVRAVAPEEFQAWLASGGGGDL